LGSGGKGPLAAVAGGGAACVTGEAEGAGAALGVLVAVSAPGPEDVFVDMDGGIGGASAGAVCGGGGGSGGGASSYASPHAISRPKPIEVMHNDATRLFLHVFNISTSLSYCSTVSAHLKVRRTCR
jgi:hypothetical protein